MEQIYKTLLDIQQALFALEKSKPVPVADAVIVPKVVQPDLVYKIAKAIQQKEGFFKPGERPAFPRGTLSYRCNNPGNMGYTSYTISLGATSYVWANGMKFAVFPTYEVGMAALCTFLRHAFTGKLYRYRPTSRTLLQFFEVYAPREHGNDPVKYTEFVSSQTGISAKTQIWTLVV